MEACDIHGARTSFSSGTGPVIWNRLRRPLGHGWVEAGQHDPGQLQPTLIRDVMLYRISAVPFLWPAQR
jgi:hypothetical protein